MGSKTHQERLFGAACVYITLERTGFSPAENDLYLSTLTDLDVSPGEVEQYLSDNRKTVEDALESRRSR